MAGALFGGVALVNATALVVAPLAVLSVLLGAGWRPGRWWQHPLRPALAIFLAASAVLPLAWEIRGAVSLPEGARSGSDRFLSTMVHGHYPGWVHEDPRLRYYAYREDPEFPKMRRSLGDFAEVFGQRFAERPLRYLSWYLLEKPVTLWSWSILQGQGDVYVYPLEESGYQTSRLADATRILMKATHPLVLVAALLGVGCVLGRGPEESASPVQGPGPRLLLALVAYYTVVYTVTAPWPRYAIPLRPELYLLAIYGAHRVGSRWRERGGPRDGSTAEATS